ncbi:LacI family DNA-binding transcriptional regulator [Clostridium sp.]|uniref:LacI family DNA-binding transcriptional regulator n=1 Tax=Clostridium sp. TaxID=1506 RepID=UPI003F394D68
MATLKEIAEKVGVSVATVSRVLNNDSGILVSDDTKLNIFKVADELEYKTVKQRKGKLKENKSICIGIVEMYDVLKQLEDPYYLLLRNIVERECFQNELKVVKLFRESNGYECIEKVDLDGIIAIGKFSETEINFMAQKTNNIVFLDSSPNDEIYDSVKINFKLGVKQGLDYFVKLGHSKIGFIGERYTLVDSVNPTIDDRLRFFNEYMKNINLLNEDYIIDCNMTSKGGYDGINSFIEKKKEMPTAFFIANDAVATGVIRGLQENKIDIPKDVSIIGFNDTIISQYLTPPLTSIKVHIERLGRESVSLMLERISNRSYPKKVIIPSEFIERESVKKL